MGNCLRVSIFLVLCIFIQSSTSGRSLEPELIGRRSRAVETKKSLQETETRFLLFKDETNKGCQIRLNHPDTLRECGFNSSLPLVVIIHGWSVDGMLESWVWQMAAALKSRTAQPVNVGLADWITWLDAAGPLFEGTSPSDHLSPDDANFVDAIHTFTQEHMGLSVGIKQPVGHYDFYPNGGSFQPGCHFLELYKHIAQHGLNAISQTIKCAHERSVHLFIDSLLHDHMQSMAYQCSDMDSFSQGLCLSCKKGRCNTLGYHIRQERHSKSKKLFLVTRAQSPFKVYHYQFKIQFINQIEKPVEPTFTMSLLGTKEERQKIPITLGEGIISNKTYSFLITLDLDIGELIMIRFKWENSAVWANIWNTVQTIIPWGTKPHYSGLVLKTIRVKAGETQQRMTFCSEITDDLQLHPTQEKTFVKCEVNSKKSKRKIR
ncbi:hepatic triacylglycerol lipase [Marmota monax]|uniref:Hepatic triacylglycerol lipase n=1 Tax=Marmota monax TaxID=9995 RepID=A0A834UWV5_MARMO|nr:hepatic triacylglycerol lipase [Marmota monax]